MLDKLTQEAFKREASACYGRKMDRISNGGLFEVRPVVMVSSKPSPPSKRQKELAKRKQESMMSKRARKAERTMARKMRSDKNLPKIKLSRGADYSKHFKYLAA